ncbi:MAG TPA: FtsX-like permease family protein [Planctomycetota bacterium]
MALRYLRAHRILYFSIAGVAFGLMTLVVVTSVMGGFSRDLRTRIRGMSAHFVVVPFPSQYWFADYERLAAEIEKVPHVLGCAPRLEYACWLGRGGVFDDVQIVGVIPEAEKKISELGTYFRKGGKAKFDFTDDAGLTLGNPGVVVGAEMRSPRTIGLLTARYDNGPLLCQKDFEVVGNFRSGMAEYDSKFLFMDLAAAQDFLKVQRNDDLGARPRVNTLAVAVDDYEKNGAAVRKGITEAIHRVDPCDSPEDHASIYGGGRCKHRRVRSWEQTRQMLLQAVEVEKAIMIIVLMMIVLVAGFNIISINTLVVRAKTRDIGILRALGATKGGVIGIFLAVGLLCGFFGSFFGILLGLLFSYNVNDLADLIRVTSRDLNRASIESGGLLGWLALLSLAAAGAGVIWTWLVLYKERLRTPWVRIVTTGLLLGFATWTSTTWLSAYQPVGHYDPDMPGRWGPVVCVMGFWAALTAAWRFLDRWRLRPAWIFFSAFATIAFSVLALALAATTAIAGSIVGLRPAMGWPGLELFPTNIYYLDRIPVYVDFTALGVIVALTLLISLIFSIYPAIRASRSNPIEAIRDE